jgi:hypothetical protein
MMRFLRRRDQWGAVLPEAAIVLPIVALFVFGILEYGLFFRDSLTASNISRDGARAGAAASADYDADYYIIQQVLNDAKALNGGVAAIDYIVIYNPSGPASPDPSPACAAGDNTQWVSDGRNGSADTIGACNVYLPADINMPKSSFDDPVGTSFLAPQNWPGTHRNQYHDNTTHARSDGTAGPDYIGVYVHLTHHFVTGLFGNTIAVTDAAMLKIERRF